MFFIVSVLIYALRSVLRSALGSALSGDLRAALHGALRSAPRGALGATTDATGAIEALAIVDATYAFVADATKTRRLADADDTAAAEAIAVIEALAVIKALGATDTTMTLHLV